MVRADYLSLVAVPWAALTLMSCGPAATPVAATAETILAAPSPEGADPAIRRLTDQGNPNRVKVTDPSNGVRRVVVDLECPEGEAVQCGASATRAVAIWLAGNGARWGENQGEAVTDLLVNVNGPSYRSFQLMGALPAADTLSAAGLPETLTLFHWNGGDEVSEVEVAKWCLAGGSDRAPSFCQAFCADEADPTKPDEVISACPASR